MKGEVIKDFDLTIKLRNNQLVERREEVGMSAPQFARAIGVSYPTYLWFENMKSKPFRKGTNRLREPARKILEFWDASVSEIWPDAVHAVINNKVSRKIDGAHALSLAGEYSLGLGMSVNRLLESKETLEGIDAVLKTLTPREEEVIRRRFGIGCEAETFDNVAETLARSDVDGFGISGARVRQIEDKALRKLRHSGRSKQLKDYMEAMGGDE